MHVEVSPGNGTLESAAKYEARESVQSHLASILLFRTTMSYELLRKWRVLLFTKKVVLKSHLQQTHGKQRLNYTNPECKSWTVTSWSIFQHVWNIRAAQSQFFVNCFTTFVAKICMDSESGSGLTRLHPKPLVNQATKLVGRSKNHQNIPDHLIFILEYHATS